MTIPTAIVAFDIGFVEISTIFSFAFAIIFTNEGTAGDPVQLLAIPSGTIGGIQLADSPSSSLSD